MDLEYLKYCLSRLTDSQFTLYCALRSLPTKTNFTLSEIAEIMGRSPEYPDRLRCHFKSLEKKGFIIYRTLPGYGHEVLWVRLSADEKTPDAISAKRRAAEYTVIHPDFGSKALTHGNIRRFVERNNLNYRAFRAVLSGERNHHHGWRLG